MIPFRHSSLTAALLGLLTLSACDTTPRERQEIVRDEARKLDTLADRAADKLRNAGRRAARYDSAARIRNRQPLDAAATATFTQQLLGSYSDVESLTPATIEPAYVQLLRQTRAQRRQWSQRDWDYATSIYKRLNEQLKAIRLDVKGRDEVHIRALQAEFTALETSRDVKDIGQAVKN
ncbi:hypothetical protein [Hymenobacter cellulosilyticus]|uniref:Lipoprotein n=1 Tax=Hymenobacter cellulosilyticus TaxID=2932248 RepID=A0A8T9QC17_9BACT|nr:hypothetical protein [Hymenobacter cellulosilyticus]UOQ73089.1 hypothetical protein MUN79_03690 [Hymenobacter cellulosilyticus]